MSSNSTITSADPANTTPTVLPTTQSSIETTPTPTTTAPTTPVSIPTTPTTSAPVTQPTTQQTTEAATTPATTPTTTPATTPATTVDPTQSSSVVVSVVTVTPTDGISSGQVTTEYITSTQAVTSRASSTSSTSSSSTASGTAGLSNAGSSNSGSKGISSGGTIAIAVVVPIVAVAALIAAGLFFWRRRKQRKDAEEMRRKEVEEYGYNPNNDPTIPAVGSGGSDGPFEMREEEGSGYRGWGTTAVASSGRKASTTLSGGQSAGGIGMAYSDGSPTHALSDTRSDNPLVDHHEEEGMGVMGPATAGNRDINRGPSNASSSYSAAGRSDGSGEAGYNGGGQYYDQYGGVGGNPYTDATPYGSPQNRAEAAGQPIIRDVSARRNTRIENPSHYPGQQSAGISQNF
ncbi:hypothetical protein BCIN_14g01020 [Botrytis cinerea B05.10]|uniref:Uncharacterized protein n=1 Tax=Botryotinia fuckeliana (strain B05.10) TaxID=332648 RepID=A0A384K293_BOTFB|nr:hypothetical protein BCIN_14g01020 [Botrytis cinerea B05.10]ATZ56892.1 hypothetical protein BCIN_14g01020 [Botrytis cinerea B05.10]